MRDINVLREEARYLYEHLRTEWSNYDFSEKSNEFERRVPRIRFLVDVEPMCEEVYLFDHLCKLGRYVRECQVGYNGNTYIFEISTFTASDDSVMKFLMDVYTPAGDGKGGKIKLFSERI